MNLFNKSKLKVKIEVVKDITKFNIDYYKIKNADKSKEDIIKAIMGHNLCLAIIDSKLQYKDVSSPFDELITKLESLNILYRKKIVKEEKNMKVLGIAMKVSSDEKVRRDILGFVFSIEKAPKIKEITKDFNTYFYFNFEKIEDEELLNDIELYYEDEEELFNMLGLSLFDSKAFNNMSIKAATNYVSYVNDIIENLKKGYN